MHTLPTAATDTNSDLYGTNLTNVYASPFTVVGGGILYGTLPGQPMIATNA